MFHCQIIKDWFSEHAHEIQNVPEKMIIRLYRHQLLLEICGFAFSQVNAVNCATYDRHAFSFLEPALNQEDL